jgi:hypothetical protein
MDTNTIPAPLSEWRERFNNRFPDIKADDTGVVWIQKEDAEEFVRNEARRFANYINQLPQ